MEKKLTKGDQTKEKVIRMAIREFSKKGFDQASLQDISSASGISHPALLYHFKSKLGLFSEVCEKIFSQLEQFSYENFEKKDRALVRLQKFLEAHITWMVIYRSHAEILLLLSYFAGTKKEFVQIYSTLIKGKKDWIEDTLYAAQREGLEITDTKIEVISHLIIDTILGMIMNGLGCRNTAMPMDYWKNKIELFIKEMTLSSSEEKI